MNSKTTHSAAALDGLGLPILEVLPELITALEDRDEVVLQAPPGAGKTTCVPLAMLDQAWLAGQKILMLEPRRLAARSAAFRMAELLNESVGETIGYRMRLESKIGPKTRIEVITEGVFTRILQDDPSLDGVGLVIFDEFHERHLDADLALSLSLKGRGLFRDDSPLKIIVMSATLDAEAVAKLLGDAPVVTSEGRTFSVALHYAGASPSQSRMSRRDLLDQRLLQLIKRGLKENPDSSLLVFLPGQGEITRLAGLLKTSLFEASDESVAVCQLFGNLSFEEQKTAILPVAANGFIKRKVVLATNIAETSLTIEGIDVVVDSGLERSPIYDPATAMMRLQTQRISRAASDQRAGRAGRLRPGVCYRLWSEDAQKQMARHRAAEIQNADLVPMALQLFSWGVNHPDELDWLDKPPAGAWQQAVERLVQLGGVEQLNSEPNTPYRITAHGELMAGLPVHPRLAHLLLAGEQLQEAELACLVAACLSERDPFSSGGQSGAQSSNQSSNESVELDYRIDILRGHISCPSRHRGWLSRVKQLAKQYQRQLSRITRRRATDDIEVSAEQLLAFLVACAYPDRIARRRHKGGYQLANGRSANFASVCRLDKSPWLVVADLSGASGGKGDVIRSALSLDPELFDSALDLVVHSDTVTEWDKRDLKFIAENRRYIGALVLSREEIKPVPMEAKNQALMNYVAAGGLSVLKVTPAARQWMYRAELLRVHCYSDTSNGSKSDWPNLSEAHLLTNLHDWLAPYLTNVNNIKGLAKIELLELLKAKLNWQQLKQIDAEVPERITVPSGASIAIDYEAAQPVLAVKLQEMFGLEDTPKILGGKVTLLIHLLSPARRPLQVTSDLAGFWRTSYHEVKKEMKGRYPKHPWPDDPIAASATAKTKHYKGKRY